jgi:uncharacterized membrane protein YqiK
VAIALLVAFLAGGWAITGFLYIFRIRDARDHISFLSEAQAEAQDLRIEAERARAIAETQTQFMAQTLQNTLQRPAVAVMTDENIQQLAALVESFMKPANKLN